MSQIVLDILNNCSISCLERNGHTDIFISCEDDICQKIEENQDAVLSYIKNKVKNVNLVMFKSTNSSYKATFELCSLEDDLNKQTILIMTVVLIFQCLQIFTSSLKTLFIQTYQTIKTILKAAKDAIKGI
jgi:hypothetical protein